MRVDVLRLVEALHRAAWRSGMVRPELLCHRVDADGNHHITLDLDKQDVVYTPPVHVAGRRFGASVGTNNRKTKD